MQVASHALDARTGLEPPFGVSPLEVDELLRGLRWGLLVSIVGFWLPLAAVVAAWQAGAA